jgi:hypothetical protein
VRVAERDHRIAAAGPAREALAALKLRRPASENAIVDSLDDLAVLVFFLRTIPRDDPDLAALAALRPRSVSREFPCAESLRLVRRFGSGEVPDRRSLLRRLVEAEAAAAIEAERPLLAA